jgi:histidine phosphotransferase ChpT
LPNRLRYDRHSRKSLESAMSAPLSGPIALGALDLAALLCSRVCHDLISPVGAIVNGLEVLEEDQSEETKTFAMDLIKKSAQQASAKLQFCRIAFGAAGSAGAQIDLGDAEKVARGLLADDKIAMIWNLPRELLGKNRVKLLLNMLLVAVGCIPRGGTLTVDPAEEGKGFRITASGLNARLAEATAELLAGSPARMVDAHAIQPVYTGILARDCGLTLSAVAATEQVVVTAC